MGVTVSGPPIWLCETKTSSEDITYGSTFWRRTRIDPQISTYLKGARAIGLNAIGVLYDVLHVVQLKPMMATPVESRKYTQPTKKNPISKLYANQRDTDELPEEFGQRCLDEIVKNPSRYYVRGEVVRLESEQHEADVDVWQTTIAMRESRRLNMYPRTPGSCVQWSRECEYMSVCCGEASLEDPVLFTKIETEHEELELSPSGRTRVTQSSLKSYRRCPRYYQIRNVRGYRPNRKAEPLRRGTSLHGGIEILRKTGSLELAIDALDKTDPWKHAKEKAMLTGWYVYWGKPEGIVAVEKQFEIDLINPSTGAASKTYSLAGKFDAACLANPAYLQPIGLQQFSEQTGLENLLEQSITAIGPTADEADASE